VINLLTGPEIVAGSTRLKAGTATKVALNIISTGVNGSAGRLHGNLMIDLQPTTKNCASERSALSRSWRVQSR